MTPRDNGGMAAADGTGEKPPRQPAFNLTPVVKILLLTNLLIYLAVNFGPGWLGKMLVGVLAFTPGFFLLDGPFSLHGWAGLFGHMFLHIQGMHFLVNMGGLLAFGTPVERALGTVRFIALYVFSGMIGIGLDGFLAGAPNDVYLGASAAVTGLFGGVLMILFGAGPDRRAIRRAGGRERIMTLVQIVAIVVVLNVVIGLAGMPGVQGSIAWVAHLGGLGTGLALYPLLARPAPGPSA